MGYTYGLSRLCVNNNLNLNANWNNFGNSKFISKINENDSGRMAWHQGFMMKTYNNIYSKIISIENLYEAYKKARKSKSNKDYVIKFEKNLFNNLENLHNELKNLTYSPKPLETFILRDPKTRIINKSDFKDRIVHHALCNTIGPIFDKSFIYDSYANRNGKGGVVAIKRFDEFKRRVSQNGRIIKNKFKDNNYVQGYCLKADIKHYFNTVDHNILMDLIERKIKDTETIILIKIILSNFNSEINGKGMPLGNLTSQFFANIYLNELDYFIKHKLKAEYYIRYVDDFVILHKNRKQLEVWKDQIGKFLNVKLKLVLHPEKSKIIHLSQGIDFLGFRNFYHFKLLRKRNIKKMRNKIEMLKKKEIDYTSLLASYKGWEAYAKWADTYKIRRNMLEKIKQVSFRS